MFEISYVFSDPTQVLFPGLPLDNLGQTAVVGGAWGLRVIDPQLFNEEERLDMLLAYFLCS